MCQLASWPASHKHAGKPPHSTLPPRHPTAPAPELACDQELELLRRQPRQLLAQHLTLLNCAGQGAPKAATLNKHEAQVGLHCCRQGLTLPACLPA